MDEKKIELFEYGNVFTSIVISDDYMMKLKLISNFLGQEVAVVVKDMIDDYYNAVNEEIKKSYRPMDID